jgi:hypothetical protein
MIRLFLGLVSVACVLITGGVVGFAVGLGVRGWETCATAGALGAFVGMCGAAVLSDHRWPLGMIKRR